jgi:hypothetical protein
MTVLFISKEFVVQTLFFTKGSRDKRISNSRAANCHDMIISNSTVCSLTQNRKSSLPSIFGPKKITHTIENEEDSRK